MYEVKWEISDDELLQRFRELDEAALPTRFGWLHDKLHMWAWRHGFHDLVVGNRFYRWWGRQKIRGARTYLDDFVEVIAAERDRRIMEEILPLAQRDRARPSKP